MEELELDVTLVIRVARSEYEAFPFISASTRRRWTSDLWV
jgi:hypothetical protein